jgi:hypothetical protein
MGGVNPETFFKRLKLPGQNVSHHVMGNRMAHFRSLSLLYQVLIDGLHFYILRSRPCRTLEKVSKIGDLKILIWVVQTIQYVRVMPDFEAVVVV